MIFHGFPMVDVGAVSLTSRPNESLRIGFIAWGGQR
jgi:hypothetical protein